MLPNATNLFILWKGGPMVYTEQVSIIVPYTRTDLVEVLLTKLLHQTYPSALTEIILVGQRLASLAKRWPMIKPIETTQPFLPGKGRNIGAQTATGRYLLFIDDDCEPEPDWIEQNIRELQNIEVGAVGGQITGKSKTFFAQCVDFSSFAFCQTN